MADGCGAAEQFGKRRAIPGYWFASLSGTCASEGCKAAACRLCCPACRVRVERL